MVFVRVVLVLLSAFALSEAATSPSNAPLVTGIVTRADTGQPLTAVRVTLLHANASQISAALTTASGAFQFLKVPQGALSLVAEASGYTRSQVPLTLASGVTGFKVSIQLLPSGSTCPRAQCVTITALRAAEVVSASPLSSTVASSATSAPVAHTAAAAAAQTATPTAQAAATNAPADFTIQSTIAAPAPPRFGFDYAASSQSANNMFTFDGGMGPYDARLSFNATTNGTPSTFIANDCSGGACAGTDYYQSIATGYFNGAQARAYHFNTSSKAWQLINTGTVSSFTANSSSLNASDHTITLNQNGTASQTGDAIWLTLDNVGATPSYSLLDPRLQAYGSYAPEWNYETGSTLSYMITKPVTASNPQPYAYVADGPPGDSIEAGVNLPLSVQLTDGNNEFAGITQFFLGTGSATESLEAGHTYQVSVWLKQTGIANGSVYFSIRNSQAFASTTFTGVNGTWQLFTYQFPGFQAPSSSQANPQIHIDFQAPGTLWVDQVQISDTGYPALTTDPRVISAWQTFAPSTIRMWSNFGNTAGTYTYWGLDSWLAADNEDHMDPGIGSMYERQTLHAHLPSSLALAKSVGSDPWLICNMSLSEAEWGNLIDYLAAPAGTGYASLRPASHPGPYTADFNHIYLEFGNEEWGTQQTAVNAHYGEWVHYMLSQAIAGKSYFDPAKIKFVVNGFTLVPSIGSAAAAAAPEASVVDIFTYNNGDTSLIPAGATTYPDAYYQTDLLSLVRNTATYGNSVQNLINAQVAQQKADAANGLVYSLAVYEGGPGGDITSTQGDTSLAAAVGNLDTFLYSSLKGIQQQNFFLFNFGVGPYSSHSYLWDGFRPHPAWEALQMRNQYCNGDMVNISTNTVPVTSDGNSFPLISTYAFHEVNAAGVDQYDVFVLSRDLNNATPVTIRLPGSPSGSGTLYTLTGDPRANNDTALIVPIAQTSLSGITANFQFTMPPGSVYLFQIPLTSSTSVAVPTASLSSSSLTFASQSQGTTSAAQTVNLTNPGSAALSVASIAVSGANASDFAVSNNCGSTLGAGGSCAISVTFTPGAPGSRSATLLVTDNSSNVAGSTQTVALTGAGTVSGAVTPSAFTTYLGTYGSPQPNYTGASAVIPLRAYSLEGASQVTILQAIFAPASGGAMEYEIFAASDDAGGYTLRLQNGTTSTPWPLLPLDPSGVTVTLATPITLDTMQIIAYRFALVGNEFQLDLTVSRTGAFSDQIVILGVEGTTYSSPWYGVDGLWSSTTTTPTPSITVSTASVNFGSQATGASSTQTVTVTSNGTAPLSVTSVQIAGTNAADFAESNSCTSSLAPGATCAISLIFDPLASGTRTASLSITNTAPNSPQVVALSGVGVAPVTPKSFTTYLGAYGSAQPAYHGTSAVIPLRAYDPLGASQLTTLQAIFASSGGAMEYEIFAQTDNAGGYTLRLQNSKTSTPWPLLPLNPSGQTVTLSTPITLGSVQITAYRFALLGNEFQLDVTVSRVGTFSDQIVILGVAGHTYSSPWYSVVGKWTNP